MQVEQRAFAVGTRVVETFAVGGEFDGVVDAGGEFVFQRLLSGEAIDAHRGLVGAALAHLVGKEHTVAGNVGEADRSVRVAADGGGIDESVVFGCRWLAFWRSACPAAAHVDGGLLFAGEALHEVVVAGALEGDCPARSVLKRVKIVDDLISDGVLLQIARGVGVLLVDEVAGFSALGVFEPAVVIGNFRAEVVVDDGGCFGNWWGWKCNAVAAVDGLSEDFGAEKNNDDYSSDAPHLKNPLPDRILGETGWPRVAAPVAQR